MSKSVVSVIIPCFNYGAYLEESVNSVLEQTRTVDQIIIIDDGSTDNTKQVAKNLCQKSPKVGYYRVSNQGPAAARNRGIEKARGEYIIFLDADDTLESTCIQACLKAARQYPKAGYVYTQSRFFGEKKGDSSYPAFDLELLKSENYIHSSSFFRAEVFEKVRFNESLRSGLEDWDLYLRLAERGIYGQLLNEPLLRYRKHSRDQPSISDRIETEIEANKVKLQVQMKHIRFIGFGRTLHTAARLTRLRLGITR